MPPQKSKDLGSQAAPITVSRSSRAGPSSGDDDEFVTIKHATQPLKISRPTSYPAKIMTPEIFKDEHEKRLAYWPAGLSFALSD